MNLRHYKIIDSIPAIVGMLFSLILLGNVSAQQERLDPSDMFFTTYNYEKDGKMLLEQKNFDEAINKFNNAKKLLNTIHVQFPRWNPKIVANAHTRVTQLIKKVDHQKKLEADAKAGQPKLFKDPESTPRLEKVKRKVAQALKNDSDLPSVSQRYRLIERQLETKEKELEERKIAAANKADLIKMLKEKDAEIEKLKNFGDLDQASTTQRERLLKSEIQALQKQLSTASNSSGFSTPNVDLKEREKEIAELKAQTERLEKERGELAEANQENIELAKRSQQEIAELKEVIAKSNQRLENETLASNRKINEINKELLTLEADKKTAQKKLKTLEAEMKANATSSGILDAFSNLDESDAQMIEKLKNNAAKIEVQRKELLEKKQLEIEVIKAGSDTLNAALAEAEKSNAEANKAITQFQAQVEAKDQQMASLSKQLDQMQAEQEESQGTILSQSNQISELQTGIDELKQERDLLLMRPLKTEVLSLEENLALITKEKQSLSAALATNEEKYYEAVDRIEILQKELEGSRGVTSQFEKNVNDEREISNEIISTQRKRLASQKKMLDETTRALSAEQAKADKLQTLLDQANEQYAELNDKHEVLIAEHEQLQTLIDGKTDSDILRRQQLKLKSELIATQKAYQALSEQEGVQAQDLAMARKQYALARTDLNKARHQLELSNMRSDKLRNQLIQAQSELQLAASDPNSQYSSGEIQVLRELVDKQLKLQKNRKQVRSIILDQVNRLGIDDTEFIRALNLSETQELQLTKEQQELLANQNADGEFRFTDRASPEERKLAEAELSRKLKIYDKMGREAFQKERFAAAEEFFKLNLDAHPGHIPSMLNLGVLKLRHAKNKGEEEAIPEAIETFEDAIAMSGDQTVPYAHQMLGYAHYLTENFEEASKQFGIAIEADPTNANAHILLADIASENSDFKRSESHLLSAMKIDATLSEPHFNLAKLYFHQEKYTQALKQYRIALRKGASPAPKFDNQLQQKMPAETF